MLLAGWAAVRLHDVVQGRPVLVCSALIAAGWAGLSAFSPGWMWVGGLSAAEWILEVGQAILLDLPLLVLGVWCLREMAPIRFSARVILILLIAILESFLAARPAVTWTMGAGALLMGVGVIWLLREGEMSAPISAKE